MARYEQGKLEKNIDVNINNNNDTLGRPLVIRGKLRVLPGSMDSGASFISDDCGRFARDVWIPDAAARNRALDGDVVYVELLPIVNETTATTATMAETATPAAASTPPHRA